MPRRHGCPRHGRHPTPCEQRRPSLGSRIAIQCVCVPSTLAPRPALYRHAQRAQFVLAAARGDGTTTIARAFRVRPATVSKWRTRFAARRVAGLQDDARPGAPVRYGAVTEDRILALLDTV